MSTTALSDLGSSQTGGGKFRIGSEEHKVLFCRMFLDSYDPYKPAVIEWPELAPDALARLTSLPFWDIAVRTEESAGRRMEALAAASGDALIREAVNLNAFEERRHKDVLGHMIRFYGIKLEPEEPYVAPTSPLWGFLRTGYGECFDSFFAFGLFALAKQSGYFPPELVDTFEPVMQEEARHILFFRNWVAWHRARLPLWRKIIFDARRVAVFARLIWQRAMIARGAGGNNFTATGHRDMGINVKAGDVIDTCLAENDRRMLPYDARLLRPTLVPRLARLARRFV